MQCGKYFGNIYFNLFLDSLGKRNDKATLELVKYLPILHKRTMSYLPDPYRVVTFSLTFFTSYHLAFVSGFGKIVSFNDFVMETLQFLLLYDYRLLLHNYMYLNSEIE